MSNISFKTEYAEYIITGEGQNLSFAVNKGDNLVLPSPFAYITNNDREKIPSVYASLADDELTIKFADGTSAKIFVETNKEFITFTLGHISREDFLSVTYVNIELMEHDMYCGCLMGMTLSTKMEEHPGYNRILSASAYPHIGLYSTRQSSYPSKAAVIGAPKDMLCEIQKKVIKDIPKGELPISYSGGPYAERVKKQAKGIYTVFNETVTMENIDDVIDSLKRFSIDQITLHHYGHYKQGEFEFDKNIFPHGKDDFKGVVDRFHEEGILVGIQPYSFFLVPESHYVTPIPHKDLDTLREFTLKEDIDTYSKEFLVCESTEGMSPHEAYLVVNSPYLWIDDEIIKFTKVGVNSFLSCERGAYGTKITSHKQGAKVRQLKQYFLLPLAKAGSELFYEIARNTARFYNECGADYMYLDALDGSFVLEGEEYVWYHAVDFIREMYKYLEREPVFDCCYNPQYTGSWYVRSRYGAVDESLNGHRQYLDAHMNYNMETAERMGITGELGWINLYPKFSPNGDLWQNEPVSYEDLEYFCAKVFSTESSLAFLRFFHTLKDLPCSHEYCKILKKYADYKKTNSPSPKTKEYLKVAENGAILEDNKLIKAKYIQGNFERNGDFIECDNTFSRQSGAFRIDAMCSASEYDNPDAITLCSLSEDDFIENKTIRFDTPLDSKGRRGIGVWCCGDNSGAVVCIGIRDFASNAQKNSLHFIKVNFTGWRYFAFYEPQNGSVPHEVYPRKELSYKSYNDLQNFYHHYRVNINYSAIHGVDISVKGSGKIRLKDIRLLPHVERSWINPTIKTDVSELKIFTELKANHIISFDGNECLITDWKGNLIEKPEYEGEFIIPEGKSKISMSCDGEEELTRAKITVTLRGEQLQ